MANQFGRHPYHDKNLTDFELLERCLIRKMRIERETYLDCINSNNTTAAYEHWLKIQIINDIAQEMGVEL